jgi:hypothetical protein
MVGTRGTEISRCPGNMSSVADQGVYLRALAHGQQLSNTEGVAKQPEKLHLSCLV